VLGVNANDRIRLRFAIWRNHLPLDSLPLEGWIDLFAVAEEELASRMYSVSAAEIED
jgi:hypothetical protein